MVPERPRRLSVQRLFLLTVVLKIAASLASWLVGSPWLLGFAVPLLLMALYIGLGMRRADTAVSDEKFADSCYYLGFIFTLSSILVALLDIPSIASRLGDISVRFGAAMVSTVLGLIVRVYLVNFRPDFQDAIRVAEDGLLDSVRDFRGHLDFSVDRLREFQNQVHDAARLSVDKADLAIQDAAAVHARHFGGLLEQLAAEHRQLVEASAEHMKATTQTLANALHDYALALASGSGRFEADAAEFSGKLEARLNRLALPEDYFASRLDPALAGMERSAAEAGECMAAMAADLGTQARQISAVLEGLVQQIRVLSMTMAQAREAEREHAEVLDMARRQTDLFSRFGQAIEKMEASVNRSLASIGATEQAVRRIVDQLDGIAGGSQEIGQLVQRQTELAAATERNLAEWLPRLRETETRRAGHLNEAIHALDRSVLKVAAAAARQETTLAEVAEQFRVLADRLADRNGTGGRLEEGSAPPVRRTGSAP